MTTERRILLALALLTGVLVLGTVGYMSVEHFGLFEALYMTVITITTVGFGEVHTLSEGGRIFTILLIFTGFACITFMGHAVVQGLLESTLGHGTERRKMKKRISGLKGHHIICGFGRVGAAALEELQRAGSEFVIVDTDQATIESLREHGHLCLMGDGTNDEILLEAGVKRARGLLSVLPLDALNLFIALTARDLNPTLQIVARVEDHHSRSKLLRAGADQVISPHTTAGTEIAKTLLGSEGTTDATAPASQRPNARWVGAEQGSPFVGKTIEEASAILGSEIIGMRRGGSDRLCPGASKQVELEDDLLVLEMASEAAEDTAACATCEPLVVIVDENPVLTSLYVRMLRRVGIHPVVAGNGGEAIALITAEKPQAVVIDWQLPDMTGAELCQTIRADPACGDVKLILLSGDGVADLDARAVEAGADAALAKGPECSQLIETVFQVIN